MVLNAPASALTFDHLLEKVDGLGVLPHVVFKVLEISDDHDAPAADIERLITVDPGFSSKVLVLANSASFGIPKKVTSIREAVMFLGFRNLRNIALTVGTYDLFVGKSDRESLRRRSWWKRSIDTAVASRHLAQVTRLAAPDEAYTCGLLHVIGKTIIDRYAGLDYHTVTEMEDLGIPDYLAEGQIFGYDHSQVTVRCMNKWGLPESLQSGLDYLHAPDRSDPAGDLRACTALATGIALQAQGKPTDPPTWAIELLGYTAETYSDMESETLDIVRNTEMHL